MSSRHWWFKTFNNNVKKIIIILENVSKEIQLIVDEFIAEETVTKMKRCLCKNNCFRPSPQQKKKKKS